MAYQIASHTRRGNTRYLSILVNPDAPVDQQVIERFEWGWDVSLASVRKETKLLLDEKYGRSESVLPGTGTILG